MQLGSGVSAETPAVQGSLLVEGAAGKAGRGGGCTFSMRVVASDSWTPAKLKQAETVALSQANFAWNSSENSGYRMGVDFWRGIGLQPADDQVKQMLITMFKQPDGGNQKRILSTVGLPFDLE